MIEEYFNEKKYVIEILREIYKSPEINHQDLLTKFCNQKKAGLAIEMNLIDLRISRDCFSFSIAWTQKAHNLFQ
jgi:hypothetical protein